MNPSHWTVPRRASRSPSAAALSTTPRSTPDPAPAPSAGELRPSAPSERWWRQWLRQCRRVLRRRMVRRLALALTFVMAVTSAWVWTPLSELDDVDRVSALLAPLRAPWWGTLAGTLGVALAALAFVPMTPLVLAAVLTYGPAKAFFVVFVAAQVSAALGYGAGRSVLGDSLRHRLDRRVPLVAAQLDRAALTTFVMRLVPVAPFTVVNLVAGSARLGFGGFALGTVFGVIPNTALMVWASDALLAALRDPSWAQIGKGAATLAGLVVVSWGLSRLVRKHERASRAP